ncbi:GGDEF domain-containing protein [Gottfriedia acidiceleris]|uniref:GGDEF domain-containing protein n=1 Tax=Gottfriedia acidiceleris TaxID=371036 RepID=A0ABY4JNY9_9BACI|nr:GGDEF domain-containing protein [Gottfriedia acidiceleris]UPM55556.1 GGDEF domain-containing protein [Gottfriedia acidiceleris]
MLFKNIFITHTIIISFFYLTSSILWGEARQRFAGKSKFQEFFIGFLLSGLTILLLNFPIFTDHGTNIQIKTLGMEIAAIFFGNITLVTMFFFDLIAFYFINGFNFVYLIDSLLLLFVLCFGFYMKYEKWDEKKRILILTPMIILFKCIGFYLIEKWMLRPVGVIVIGRLLQTIGFWFLMYVPALLLSYFIAYQTRNTEIKLKKMENIANVDSLTGLYNRRYFEKQLLNGCSISYESSIPITLLMIDVDYFKKYNDLYGHPKGDECLRRVATSLQLETTSELGIVARYGGEEFSILLPKTDLNDALKIGNRLCKNIKKLKIEHEQSEKKLVTLSIGVASLIAENDQDYLKLVKQADQALYRSKHNGRDQVSY